MGLQQGTFVLPLIMSNSTTHVEDLSASIVKHETLSYTQFRAYKGKIFSDYVSPWLKKDFAWAVIST